MNNQWQDDLRRRMESYEDSAPEGLWSEIEDKLNAAEKPNILPIQKKKTNKIIRISAVAIAACILLFIGLFIFEKSDTQTEYARLFNPISTYSSMNISHSRNVKKEASMHISNKLMSKKKNNKKSFINDSNSSDNLNDEETSKSLKSAALQVHVSNVEMIQKLTASPGISIFKNESNYNSMSKEIDIAKNSKSREKNNKISLTNIFASGISSESNKNYYGYGSFVSSQPPSDEGYPEGNEEESIMEEIVLKNQNLESGTAINHYQPFITGVSIGYNFNKRIRVSTGLSYSRLSSVLRSGSEDNYYKKEQTLHYIGVPVNVEYLIAGNEKISTYISAGGAVDKNIAGKVNASYVIDKKQELQRTKKISVKELQWSVNTAVGLQYQLSKNIGIYAEPRLNYYFNNNSEIETIYKDKPLNFNFKIGVRVSLNNNL